MGYSRNPGVTIRANDDSQFKGVFIRNLQILQQASPTQAYAAFSLKMPTAYGRTIGVGNANLGVSWTGAPRTPDAVTQAAALDALVAVAAWSKGRSVSGTSNQSSFALNLSSDQKYRQRWIMFGSTFSIVAYMYL